MKITDSGVDVLYTFKVNTEKIRNYPGKLIDQVILVRDRLLAKHNVKESIVMLPDCFYGHPIESEFADVDIVIKNAHNKSEKEIGEVARGLFKDFLSFKDTHLMK